MATTTRIETRKRGIFGWIFVFLFWGFNAVMAFSLFAGIQAASNDTAGLTSDAQAAGAAIGTVIGVGMILTIWALGAAILGLFVYFTQGRKVTVETIKD